MENIKQTILVVDDSSFLRKLLINIIKEEENFEVIGECQDGQDVVDKNKKYLPDIIFLDITMPIMSGIECIPILKKENPNVKIIICSATKKENKDKYVEDGVYLFISKPFNKEFVKKVLKDLELLELPKNIIR